MFLSVYQFMISSPFNANIQVCERLFVHTVWSHCPPSNALCSLSLSFFNLYSNLRAAQRKEDLQFTSHKSLQIFCSFYHHMVWLLVRKTPLHASTLNLHACSSGGNPVLTFALLTEFTYELRCCKSNRCWTMPDMHAINQRIFEGRSSFWFLLRNFYLLGIVRHGQSVELLNTCIRQVKHSIRGLVQLSWWHFYLHSGE